MQCMHERISANTLYLGLPRRTKKSGAIVGQNGRRAKKGLRLVTATP